MAILNDEQLYETILESISDAVFLTDGEGRFRFVCANVEHLFGYSSDEIEDMGDVSRLLGEEILSVVRGVNDGPVENLELEVADKGGDCHTVLVNARTVDALNGSVLYVCRDVTDRSQAKKQLQDSEEKFRTLAETVPTGVYLTDPDGRCVYANTRWLEHAGMTLDQALGDGWAAGLHPEDRAKVFSSWKRMAESKGQWGLEYRFRRPDGQTTFVYGLATPWHSTAGELRGYIGSNTDITELKKAQDEIRKLRDFYETILESVQDGIWVTDRDERIIYFNEGMEHIAGVNKEDVLGMTVTRDFPPETTGHFLPHYHRAKQEQTPQRYEAEVVTPAGRTTIQSGWLVPRFDGAAYGGMICTVQDITEKKRAERKVQESEQRFRRLLDATGTAPWELDATTGAFTFVGEQMVGLFGYPLDYWKDMDAWATTVHPEDRERAQRFCTVETREGRDHDFVYRAVRKDGREIWIHDVVSVIAGHDGPERLVGFMRDVTERETAQQDLEQSERRYRTLVDGLPDVLMRFDRAFRHLYVSPSVSTVIDMEPEAFLGKTHRELGFPEELCAFCERQLAEAFQTGRLVQSEFSVGEGAGRHILDWRLVPEVSTDGAVGTVLTIARDVTEHRKLHGEYQTLFQSMLEGFASHEIILDDAGIPVDYRFLKVNRAFETLTGLKAEDVVGRTVLEVMPETERHWIEAYGRVALSGEPLRFEQFAGELDKHFEIVAFRPGPMQFACLFRDVTDQVTTRDALAASEARYRAMVETAPYGIAIADPETGELVGLNQALADMVGRTRDELIGQPQKVLHPAEEQDGEGTTRTFKRHLDTDLGQVLQTKLLRNDGETRDVEIKSDYVEVGGRMLIQGYFSDVTERTALEVQLQQAQKMEALGTLAGGIAHDFNNILGAILGYSELTLHRLPEGSDLAEDLTEVVRAGERAKELVKQILAFSRKGEPQRRAIQTHLVVGEALRLLRQAIPSSIPIEDNVGKTSDLVVADPTQLHQIVMNLCTNAYHAMRETGGRLRVTLESVDVTPSLAATVADLKIGPHVRLSVSDTGVGMDPETLRRALEPFFTTKAPGTGTGMGLAVVHGIVRSHEGALQIRSQLGRGTYVDIYLPRQTIEAEGSAQGSPAELPTGSGRILVVDDEPMLADLTGKMVASLGYQVESVSASAEGLERFLEDPDAFDLVITDQTMPGMTGDALTRRLLEVRPDLPVVICTGYSETMNDERAQEIGARGFLAKPVDRMLLAQTLREALGGRVR